MSMDVMPTDENLALAVRRYQQVHTVALAGGVFMVVLAVLMVITLLADITSAFWIILVSQALVLCAAFLFIYGVRLFRPVYHNRKSDTQAYQAFLNQWGGSPHRFWTEGQGEKVALTAGGIIYWALVILFGLIAFNLNIDFIVVIVLGAILPIPIFFVVWYNFYREQKS